MANPAQPPPALVAALERVVSPSHAKALARAAVQGAARQDAKAILESLEACAHLFVPPDKRAAAVETARRVLGGARVATRTCSIRVEADLNEARLIARQVCGEVGLRGFTAQKLVTAVSELARNIAKYASPGRLVFTDDAAKRRLQVIAADFGGGIKNLDEVLSGAYRSKTGMGVGLAGTKRLVDHFEIDTGPRGTTVTIAVAY